MNDEYIVKSEGTGPDRKHYVYRRIEQTQLKYCEAHSIDAAMAIARALNITARLEGAIVETISYKDGSEIFFVVRVGDNGNDALALRDYSRLK